MSEVDREAGRGPAGEVRRRNTKPPGGAKRKAEKSQRLQLHLGENTVKRLGVHCSLVGRNQSREAERILLRYLSREGKGRELFDQPDDEDPDAE
jgi:hypothetical protein